VSNIFMSASLPFAPAQGNPVSPVCCGASGGRQSTARLTASRGLISAAATDAIMLTNQWMGKICEKLVALYSHAPWQVGI